MSFFARIAFVLVLLVPRIASAYAPLPSELKGWSWYQSTILGGLGQPARDRGEELGVPVPGAAGVLNARLWKAPDPRGLILVVPGTGADARSGLANVAAENFAELGFDVLVLANPFSAEFQETFSRDGLVGLPQRDAPDAHRMLAAAYRSYVALHGKPRRLVLAGISLGGLYAALEAGRPEAPRFDRILALNPPPSLRAGIEKLDDMIRVSIAESDPLPFNFQVIWAYLQARHGTTLENIRGIRMFLPETEREGRRLIGDSFRQALAAVGRGVLKLAGATINPFVRHGIEANLATMTFERFIGYSGSVLAERRELGGSVESLLEQASLVAVLRRSAARPRVTVITNADDFLLRPGDLERLGSVLGDRLHVFEAGGHCGNYWTPSFRRLLAEILR